MISSLFFRERSGGDILRHHWYRSLPSRWWPPAAEGDAGWRNSQSRSGGHHHGAERGWKQLCSPFIFRFSSLCLVAAAVGGKPRACGPGEGKERRSGAAQAAHGPVVFAGSAWCSCVRRSYLGLAARVWWRPPWAASRAHVGRVKERSTGLSALQMCRAERPVFTVLVCTKVKIHTAALILYVNGWGEIGHEGERAYEKIAFEAGKFSETM